MTPLLYLEKCFSTNDEILIHTHKDESTAVFTFNQTRGRGQYGNVWDANTNQNLAYSIAVNCTNISIPNTLLNYYTAIVIRDFLANMTKAEVKIKWPNDIIMNGKKVCGILIEKKKVVDAEFFIIGIGINVLQKDFSNLPKAGSIYTTTGQLMDLPIFAEQFHKYFSSQIIQNISEDFILETYNKFLFHKDQISVFYKEKIRQNGIIKKADANGFLWIDLENEGLKKFFHKEIEMLY